MRGVLSTSVTVKDEFCFWVSLCPCHFESRCDQLGAVLSGYFVCDNFAGKQIQNHTGVKIGKMNELYHQIDPDGNIIYSSLFTQRNEVYSGSEATIFHVVKLFALQFVLRHSFPIVIDSFRAEDLSTGKENTVLEISKSIDKQVILTTTLKHEEIGKYDDLPDVNHINYQSHTPSKILDGAFVESFVALLNDLSIEI